jgi:hypothetical protein
LQLLERDIRKSKTALVTSEAVIKYFSRRMEMISER